MRERGLKSGSSSLYTGGLDVAPCAGAWVEMNIFKKYVDTGTMSLPVRERGLKYQWEKQPVSKRRRSLCGSVG